MLKYGVENRAGFTVITGEIGSGKTTLIRHLLNNLPDLVTVGLITNTQRNITEILELVMLAFGQPFSGISGLALYEDFQNFLIEEYRKGRRVILIVDEAQNLSLEVLESLRLLSNVNADKHQLLQVIITGQPELKVILSKPELQQFAQRVAVDFHISSLSASEVPLYIDHRLKVAGRHKKLFTIGACRCVAKFTNGIPRAINILCDTALMYGMAAEAAQIDEAMIEEVIRDKREYGVFSNDVDAGQT
jgi:type II secretory pathway predicted ATPase ExeA